MNKKRLIIYDKDEKYASSLMEYLGGIQDLPYVVSVFSEMDAIIKYATEVVISLLLVSESSYSQICEHVKAERVMILNESGELKWNDLQNISKYQSAENIVREILNYYVETSEYVLPKVQLHQDTKIIGFFSPVGRCSQTTMGLVLGQIMAEKYDTLYVNFESLSGFPYMMGYSGGKDLSDLMYYLETSPEKFDLHLQRCIRKLDKLDYIVPMRGMHQLLLVQAESWQKLLTALVDSGRYRMIILDLSEGMQGLFDILRMCTHIYTLTKADRFAQAKVEQYEQLLQICEYEDVLGKTHKRKIPVMKEIPDVLCYQPGSEYSGYIKKILREDGVYG